MDIVDWEDPPAESPRSRRHPWAQWAEALRSNPQRWARLVDTNSRQAAYGLLNMWAARAEMLREVETPEEVATPE